MNTIAEKIFAKISEVTPTFERGYVANGDHLKFRYRVSIPKDNTIALETTVEELAKKIIKKRKTMIKNKSKVYFDHFSIVINNNKEDTEVTIKDHYVVENIPINEITEEDENLDIRTKVNG